MIVLVGAALAASTFDVERFHPAPTGPLLAVPTAFLAEPDGLGGRFLVGMSTVPLVFVGADGSETALVGLRAGGELAARYQRGRFAGALVLPAARVEGDGVAPVFVLGDTRLEGVGRVFTLGPVSLGAAGELRLPTGDTTRWAGAGRVSGGGELVVSVQLPWLVGSATAGADTASPAETPTFRWGPLATWAAGVAVPLPARLRVIAEVDGSVPLLDGSGPPPGEWRVGAGWRVGPVTDLTLAAGRGYTDGVGNPGARVSASLVIHPRPPLPPVPPTP